MEATDIIKNVEVTDNTMSFEIVGELDIVSAPDVRETIVSAAARCPHKSIIIDLRHVEYMDSAGLALLVFCHKSGVTNKGLRLLVRPNSQPHRILQFGNFDKILSIAYSTADMLNI